MGILTFLHRFGRHLKMSEYFAHGLEKLGVFYERKRNEQIRSDLVRTPPGERTASGVTWLWD